MRQEAREGHIPPQSLQLLGPISLRPLWRRTAEYKFDLGEGMTRVSRRPDSLSLMETRRILARLRWKSKKKPNAQASLSFSAALGLTESANTKHVQPGGVR